MNPLQSKVVYYQDKLYHSPNNPQNPFFMTYSLNTWKISKSSNTYLRRKSPHTDSLKNKVYNVINAEKL